MTTFHAIVDVHDGHWWGHGICGGSWADMPDTGTVAAVLEDTMERHDARLPGNLHITIGAAVDDDADASHTCYCGQLVKCK